MATHLEGLEDKKVRPLSEADVKLLNSYLAGPYASHIAQLEDDIKALNKKVHDTACIHEQGTGLAPQTRWDLAADRQALQEEQSLQVVKCTTRLDGDEEHPRYVIEMPRQGKFVVGLGERLAPADIEEGMRVGIDHQRLRIQIPLPTKLDSAVSMMQVEERPDVTYSDVGGCDEQIKRLIEVVELPLLDPDRFIRLGMEPPRGALLCGPPGTGTPGPAEVLALRAGLAMHASCSHRTVCAHDSEGASSRRRDDVGMHQVGCHLWSSCASPAPRAREVVSSAPRPAVPATRPPGKTLAARAVANRSDAAFIRVIGSELVQRYVGEGARLVREIFKLARSKKAAIIFFDEIDAIGGTRTDEEGGDNEVQRTMMELMIQLDGFDARGNIKVLLATNRPDILDPALLRPGRVDRRIEFELPDPAGRERIFRIHSRGMSLERGIRFELLARLCPSATGADIRSVCTEAGMFAIRARRRCVTEEDFLRAAHKVVHDYQKFSSTPKYMAYR